MQKAEAAPKQSSSQPVVVRVGNVMTTRAEVKDLRERDWSCVK